MKVIAINGSPRKEWNTALALRAALDGAAETGAEVALIHLYDYTYTGCRSCFACKRKGAAGGGICAIQDTLRPILEMILKADALIIGSPIYLSDVTGQVRSLLERLAFAALSYDVGAPPAFTGHINSAFFFTMNVPEEMGRDMYKQLFESNTQMLRFLGGTTEYLACYDTLQFDDYAKYAAGRFDPAAKARSRAERFPADLEKARAIGRGLAQPLRG
jgi:multimeric flavodoxin WrbA